MTETKFEINKDDLTVAMERVFEAPRERLWQAHTNREQIEQWWGPRRYKTVVEKLDPRVGGEWRFINVDADGTRHVFYGEFHEIVPLERIVWTFIYEPYPQSVAVETLTLEAMPDGKTKISTLSKYPSIEALEGMIGGGMETGARETWDRLAELVQEN